MSCDSFSWYEPNGWVQAAENSNQCWGCGLGPRSCGIGDVVPYMSSDGEILSLYQCTGGLTSSFEKVNPGNFCKDTPIKSHDASNARVVYKKEGAKTTKTEVGDFDFYSGSSFCKYVYCLEGYMPSEDAMSCVEDNREVKCENSGGAWVNGKCSCDAAKNIKVSGEVCVCISSDYESKGRNGCQKKQSVIDAEKQQQQQAITQQRKKTCESSGGKWVNGKCSCDSSLNLKPQNNVCVCTDSNYYRDSNNNCVLTDEAARKQQCETDTSKNSGAYWDSVAKMCLCADTSLVWINGQCITDPQVTACLNIDGAEWNAILNECRCKDSSNMEFNSTRTACVLTADAQLSANQGTSRTNILNAISKLDKLSSGFKTSVWKDEEGKFNTSRLISDSVAGVVLGTAGGLITSSVVKKHQVENGFEDIQCTVGGQVVAGWGDQFQVGIQ